MWHLKTFTLSATNRPNCKTAFKNYIKGVWTCKNCKCFCLSQKIQWLNKTDAILANQHNSFYSQDSKPRKNMPTESVTLQWIYFNTTSLHMANSLNMYLNIRAAQHLSNSCSVRDEVTSLKASATKNANLSSQLIAVIPPPLPGDCVPWQQSGESSNRQPLSPKRKQLHHPFLPLFIHQPLSELTFTLCLEVESQPLLPQTSPFVNVFVTLMWSLSMYSQTIIYRPQTALTYSTGISRFLSLSDTRMVLIHLPTPPSSSSPSSPPRLPFLSSYHTLSLIQLLMKWPEQSVGFTKQAY